MTVITWAQARTAKTQAQLRALLLQRLSGAGAPVAGWSPRAPQRVLVDDFSARLAEETSIRAALAQLLNLADPAAIAAADPAWIDVVLTFFAATRIPALPAVWEMLLTCSSPPVSLGPSTPMQLQSTASGAPIFELTVPFATLNPDGKGMFIARAAGTIGNVAPSSITKILTAPAGVSISTADPAYPRLFTAGRDVETNVAAIGRALAKWTRLGAGWTAEAFDYLVPTAAPTITRWRVRDDNPYGPGTVGVSVANASGPATGPEVAAVQALVSARAVRPLGSGGVSTTAAARDALTVSITVRSDGSNAALADNITAALVLLGGPYAIGPAILDLDRVRGAALGDAMGPIDVDDGAGNTIRLDVALPGFAGAIEIVACSLTADHVVPAGAVLVLTPVVTVV